MPECLGVFMGRSHLLGRPLDVTRASNMLLKEREHRITGVFKKKCYLKFVLSTWEKEFKVQRGVIIIFIPQNTSFTNVGGVLT